MLGCDWLNIISQNPTLSSSLAALEQKTSLYEVITIMTAFKRRSQTSKKKTAPMSWQLEVFQNTVTVCRP